MGNLEIIVSGFKWRIVIIYLVVRVIFLRKFRKLKLSRGIIVSIDI